MSRKTTIWIISIISLIIIAITTIVIIDNQEVSRITYNFLLLTERIITPLSIVVGTIVAYPLLKRKLVETYISKEIEIMQEANREVRKRCSELANFYKPISNTSDITQDVIQKSIVEISDLSKVASDANPNAYRYLVLTLDTLKEISRYPEETLKEYNIDTLYLFIYNHVSQVFDYAQHPANTIHGSTKKGKYLNKSLDNLVHDNNYINVYREDLSVKHYITSQTLVKFFGTTNRAISYTHPLLLYAAYKSAPSPATFARLLHNAKIYLPPSLQYYNLEDSFPFKLELNLIGYKRMKSVRNGIESFHYEVHYGNFTNFGFVSGTMKDAGSLLKFKDSYLNDSVISFVDIDNYNIIDYKEIINFRISEEIVQKQYKKNKRKLLKKMRKELK